MAGGIDISQRKPRRLRGTPALKYVNNLSSIILAIGITFGIGLYQYPLIENIKTKFNLDLSKISDEEIDKRNLLRTSLIKPRRGEDILRLLKEKEEMEKKF